jgi:hypothetical protein
LTDYTETDPTWLSDKSNYYTTFQVDTLLSGLDFFNHTHDGRYYTKSQIDAFGFLTGFVESDPERNNQKNNYYTTGEIDANYYTKNWIDTHTVGAT